MLTYDLTRRTDPYIRRGAAQFAKNPFPSPEEIERICQGTRILARQVSDWFVRHRKMNGIFASRMTSAGTATASRGRGRRGRPRAARGSRGIVGRRSGRSAAKGDAIVSDDPSASESSDHTLHAVTLFSEARESALGLQFDSGEVQSQASSVPVAGQATPDSFSLLLDASLTAAQVAAFHPADHSNHQPVLSASFGNDNSNDVSDQEDAAASPITSDSDLEDITAGSEEHVAQHPFTNLSFPADRSRQYEPAVTGRDSVLASPVTPLSWLLAAAEDLEGPDLLRCKPRTRYSNMIRGSEITRDDPARSDGDYEL